MNEHQRDLFFKQIAYYEMILNEEKKNQEYRLRVKHCWVFKDKIIVDLDYCFSCETIL